MKEYDVIIIGGGLAGSTLGYILRKQNKKVLIVEQQNVKTKNKLCGGLLTKKSFELLCELFGKATMKKLVSRKHNSCIINDGNIKLNISEIETYSVYRKDLDDYVINQYLDINGKVIDNTTYQSIDFESNQITINNETYKYNYLVGADGIFSKLRKDVTSRQQRFNFALEVVENNHNNKLEIYFFDQFKGYAWIIPNNKNTVIGIGDISGNIKIEKDFDNYLELLNLNIEEKKGAFLPTGTDIYLNYKNIFFIGDSAGLISPITGEGIYYALRSAEILSCNMNKNYIIKMKPIVKKIKKDLFYIKFVYNKKIRNSLFLKYSKSKLIYRIINRFAKRIL